MSMESPHGYRLVSALFLRLLGVTYLIAFVSIAGQIEGLAGSQGITPFASKLASLQAHGDITAYLRTPTLFWLNSSDPALAGAAWAGCGAAFLIILGWWQRTALITAFVLYLSIYHACQPFTNFQWDNLLLESGFLALFLTPRSRVVVLLFRWLLFRLRFMSGLSKLTFGDPTWSSLTALNTYFEVQPLPTPLAWYAQHLPEWVLKAGTAGTLFVELVVPFMMFLPRRWRFAAAWLTIFWQVLILLTSNHNWFNVLTIFLCLFLFDDRAVARVTPGWLRPRLDPEPPPPDKGRSVKQVATGALGMSILLLSAPHFWELVTLKPAPYGIHTALNYASRYGVVNKYHVFPTMKAKRYELEVWGSTDGEHWKRYDFKYKPGDVKERPRVVIPFQPRVDWQMWFVTLHPAHMPWFRDFLQRLLDNSPPVTALLKSNPFPHEPPRFIRVQVYRYWFSDPDTRARTGQWWRREALGPFTPLAWVERETTTPGE